jgi:hypothetical protein
VLAITLTFLLSSFGGFVLLWALTYWLQNYLYESVVDDMALRAAIGGLILGGFYTGWTYVNTRAEFKDRYGVLQDFSPTGAKTIGEFTATRIYPNQKMPDGQVKSETDTFRKTAGSRVATFRNAANQAFRLNDSQTLTTMLTVNDGDQPIVLKPVWDGESVYARPNGRSARFIEDKGKRFLEADEPGTLYIPSIRVLFAALALNAMNFLIWVIVFWPIMRFTLGHSVGGAIGFGAIMMLMFVPLLFQQNEVKKQSPVVVINAPAEEKAPAG